MNILCLLGSPRKDGNSADMARAFCAAAGEAGARVDSVFLNGLQAQGCQGCYSCTKASEACAQNDDLSPVLALAAACDVLVLAVPLHFAEVTSQFKTFIDRAYSFLTSEDSSGRTEPSLPPQGKTLVTLLTQGHPHEALFTDIFSRYQRFFRWMGFTESHLVRASGVFGPGDAAARPGLLERIAGLARDIVSSHLGGNDPQQRPA